MSLPNISTSLNKASRVTISVLLALSLSLPSSLAWADAVSGANPDETSQNKAGEEAADTSLNTGATNENASDSAALLQDKESEAERLASGEGGLGESSSQLPPITAVSNLTYSTSSVGEVSFSWDANAEDQAVSGYEVSYRVAGSSYWMPASNIEACSWRTAVPSGKALEFHVRAYRSNGDSSAEYGESTSCITSVFVDSPQELSSTMGVEKKKIALSWTAPVVLGASSINYIVRWHIAGSPSWTEATTSKTNHTITGLETNEAYEIQVITVARINGEDYSSAPAVSRRHLSTATVSASFDSSYALKASVSSEYVYDGIEIHTSVRGKGSSVTDLGSSPSTTIPFSEGDLVTAKAHTYVVIDGERYVGMWGAKIYRAAYATTVSSTLSYSEKSLTITSSKLNANTGTAYYRIQYREGTSGSWSSKTTTSKTRTVNSISAGSIYQARVAPVVKVGDISYIGAYSYTYRFAGKAAITSLNNGGTSRTVKYSAASGATSYQIIYSTSSSFATYKTITISDPATLQCTVSGLSASQTYYFKVRAIKYTGGKNYRGPWSSAVKSEADYKDIMTAKAQSYSSSTKWLILVDTSKNKVAIFNGSKGNWTLKKYWDCTSGAASTPTVTGAFTVKAKGLSFGSGYTCWYYTQFYGNYLFHSVLYNQGSKTSIQDGRLGINASHGCIRLDINNAKWIYDNIPRDTKVIVYR